MSLRDNGDTIPLLGAPGTAGRLVTDIAIDLGSASSGLDVVYSSLHRVQQHTRARDVMLVVEEAALGRQVFRVGRRPLDTAWARETAQLAAPGLYTLPVAIDPIVSDRVTSLVSTALRLDAAQHDALRDPLTGLANRRAFEARIESASAQAERYGRGFALVLLDLDGLKAINDRLGHSAGDATLRMFGLELGRALRGGDMAARIGGDEFALVLAGGSAENTTHLLLRVARGLTTALPTGTAFSAGVAVAPDDGIETSGLDGHRGPTAVHGQAVEVSEGGVDATADDATADDATADDAVIDLREGAGADARHAGGARDPEVEVMESELRRLPGVLFVGVATRADDVVVQVGVDQDADRKKIRTAAARLAKAVTDLPVTIEVTSSGRARRIRLLDVTPTNGGLRPRVEVRLAYDGKEVVGQATGNDPVSASSATMVALRQLGADVPFGVRDAATFEIDSGEGVMVVLASDRIGRRIGAATASTAQEAGARATLQALNRHLAGQTLGPSDCPALSFCHLKSVPGRRFQVTKAKTYARVPVSLAVPNVPSLASPVMLSPSTTAVVSMSIGIGCWIDTVHARLLPSIVPPVNSMVPCWPTSLPLSALPSLTSVIVISCAPIGVSILTFQSPSTLM